MGETPRRTLKAAHVMLAGNWQFSDSPVGWFISEKFDGIRAKWTGADLISREGHRLNAPDWFTAQLPAGRQLDGELWIDRAHGHAAVAAICGPRLARGEGVMLRSGGALYQFRRSGDLLKAKFAA